MTSAMRAPGDRRFVPTRFLAASILAHGIVFSWLTPFSPPMSAQRPPLQARLAAPALPPLVAPASPPAPRQLREPPVPRPHGRPDQPVAAPSVAAPVIAMETPSAEAVVAPVATAPSAPPSAEPSAPSAAATLPAATPAPVLVAEAPPDAAALDAYARTLSVEVAKHRRYPAVARLRGWQGTAVLAISLSAGGAVIKSTVSRSSGHAVLDEQALKMVAESSPLPGVPSPLRGRVLEIELPVVFTLAAG